MENLTAPSTHYVNLKLANRYAELLRRAYPNGLKPTQYEEALFEMLVMDKHLPAIIEYEAKQSRAENHRREMSSGAKLVAETITKKPGITAEKLMKELDYNSSYLYSLIGQVKEHLPISVKRDADGKAHYSINVSSAKSA